MIPFDLTYGMNNRERMMNGASSALLTLADKVRWDNIGRPDLLNAA